MRGRSLLVRPTPPTGEVGVPCGPVIRIALPLVLLAPQGVCGIVREVLCGVQQPGLSLRAAQGRQALRRHAGEKVAGFQP